MFGSVIGRWSQLGWEGVAYLFQVFFQFLVKIIRFPRTPREENIRVGVFYSVIFLYFPASEDYLISLRSSKYWSGMNASHVLRMLLDEKHYDKRFRPNFEGKVI